MTEYRRASRQSDEGKHGSMVEPNEKDIEHPHNETPHQGAAPCCRESKFALAGRVAETVRRSRCMDEHTSRAGRNKT